MIKFLFIIPSLMILFSCKKDYVCVCENETTVDNIYYLNKIETEKTTNFEYKNTSIHTTKNKAKTECSNLNVASSTVENQNLQTQRSGGQITTSTTCQIQ